MTTLSDETLMAFADDELDPATRAEVVAAMRDDPEIGKRIAQHRALRAKLRLAYSAELDEAPPARLRDAAHRLDAVAGKDLPRATVSNLAEARAAKASRPPVASSRWKPLGALA